MWSAILAAFGRLNDLLEKALIGVAATLMGAFVATVFLEVTSRYFLGQSFIWSQDVATLCFLWSVFIAAPAAFRNDEHLHLDLFALSPGSPAARLHGLGLGLVNLAFAAIYTVLAWQVLTKGLGRVQAATGIPLEVGWASILVMGMASFLFVGERLLHGLPPGAPLPRRTDR